MLKEKIMNSILSTLIQQVLILILMEHAQRGITIFNYNNMKTITIYKLIQKLIKFDSNCRVLIKNNELYIINPDATTVDDEDIEEYENYINSIENQDSIY